MYDCTRFNSNGIWMPSVGQGYTSSCYFNTYSPTGLGYTYKSLSTGNLVYCNGLTSSSTTNLTGSYPTADKCLSAGYCWQVDYATSASQFVLPSTYPPPQQSMGCYPGDAGWSIGPSSSPAVLNAGTSFYLSDGSGNMVSLDSTGKVVLGTAGIPLNLQSVSSTGSSNWPLTPGPWTALYSPYLNAYLSSNALNSSSLTSTTTTMSLTSNWTIVVNPSNPSLNYLLNPNGCYLAWDNVNQVSYCSTSISKATGFVISTTISITSTWITSLGCYMDSSSRTLNSASMTSSTLTPQSCVTWCLNQGYTVAGIEMGAECYCSKSVNGAEYAPTQTDCPSTGVGTNWRLNVYTADPKITKPLQNLDANGYCTVCSSDGNKAMFSGNSTGTLTSNSGTNQPVSRNSILLANGVNLVMQNDGNLVLYSSTAHSTAIFSSNTWTGVNGFKAMMQVLYY